VVEWIIVQTICNMNLAVIRKLGTRVHADLLGITDSYV
jgi:hypothetical protein